MTLQACLGASKKQLGADKFGDVVKTGSATALAAVTLWNQVPAVTPPCCFASFPPWCHAFVLGTDARLSAEGPLLPLWEEKREGGSYEGNACPVCGRACNVALASSNQQSACRR